MPVITFFKNLRVVMNQRFFRYATLASVVMLAGSVLFMWMLLFPQVQELRVVPLHYNIHVGVDRVGAWWQLFMPSVIGAVLTIVNLLVAVRVWQREQVIAYAAVVTSLFVDLVIAIHLVLIALLNLAYAP